MAAVDALAAMPAAGPPRLVSNPRLAGLRTSPIEGFDLFRILHDKRDVGAILERQELE